MVYWTGSQCQFCRWNGRPLFPLVRAETAAVAGGGRAPFGLGVLDIAVGEAVFQFARQDGLAIAIPGFFGSEV
jgi:hypothetical protein